MTTFSADLKAGLQYLTYDFTYTKDAWPGYRKMLESKLKEDDSLPDMEPADDGKYYLQKGKFTVTVELGGSKSEQSFEIK
ncbi:MAG: hypothetical protein C7N36_21885 [Bacteroidetes bacterium]|nr:MAG: hypothetical protein C7N36_21885 [Bacteroidota bacterium]